MAAAEDVLLSRQQATIQGSAADQALATSSGVSCGNLSQYVSAR
jgi:hypothetical protein